MGTERWLCPAAASLPWDAEVEDAGEGLALGDLGALDVEV